ncbi:hypothetical protein CYMTET_7112, partial [Cymbomonas tetramitiformis]
MRTLCQLDTPTQRNTHLCDVPLHELVVFLREQFELFISPLEYHHEQVQHRGESGKLWEPTGDSPGNK